MSLFVQPTPAPIQKTTYVKYLSIVTAAIIVTLVVAQLYSYEDFPDVIASLWLPGGRAYASLWAAILVTLEVSSLPFLLAMRLSPAMRIVSMTSGWLVSLIWLGISIWINASVNAISNSGALGATLAISPGWWLVGIFGILSAMTAYVSWGMWPYDRSQRDSNNIK